MVAVDRGISRRRLLARVSLGILGLGLVSSLLEACAIGPNQPGPLPAATSQTGGAAGEWDKIVAAGRAEGKVLIYGNAFSTTQASKISDQFKAATGIVLDSISLLGGPATTRIREEVKVGKGPDIFEATGGWVETFGPQGSFLPLKSKPLPVWAEPESVWFIQPGYKSPDDWQYVLSRLKPRTGHIVINTQLLAESDYPRSYRELASNPKYRGKIAYLDPSATSGGATDIADYCYVAKAATANDYWGIISDQDTLLLKEAGANEVAVAQGQRAIGLPVADASILELIKAGAPVKHLYFPGVPHSTQTGEMGILSSAPHPNAALVFINWFLSKEGQNAVGPILEVSSIRRDVPLSVPDVLLGDIIGGGESKLFTQRQLQTQFTGDLQQSGVLKGLVDGTAEDEFVANYAKFVLGWESKYGGPQDQPLYLS